MIIFEISLLEVNRKFNWTTLIIDHARRIDSLDESCGIVEFVTESMALFNI